MMRRRSAVNVLVSLAVAIVFILTAGNGAAASDLNTSGDLAQLNEQVRSVDTESWAELEAPAELATAALAFTPYQDIEGILEQIAGSSTRMTFQVIGQSADGRDLFLVTIARPDVLGHVQDYENLQTLLGADPVQAGQGIAALDYMLPFYVEGSIHGNEYPGVDASLALIRTLATSNDPEVLGLLDHLIVLINPVANPDGRVYGTRGNGNGFDLNRDFMTVSQPETKAMVQVFRDWKPTVVLDLHGYSKQMLIEPCTPPHNPNYEYDLYIKWALPEALAMESSLRDHTGYHAKIPYLDFEQGWDDWPPIFAPMYAMYHGGLGHTLETPYSDQRGVDADYWAVWGAMQYAAENQVAMMQDQVLALSRGFLGLPQEPVPGAILAESHFPQYTTLFDFPTAFVLPAQAPLQADPHAAASLVDFLLFHGVRVESATAAFTFGGTSYPGGTYVVRTKQPLRGLANTILYDGWDISTNPGLTMYDISAWSLPLLWGVTRTVAWGALAAKTAPVERAATLIGHMPTGNPAAYAWRPTTNDAIRAANFLLSHGVNLLRATEPFTDRGTAYGTGTFLLAGREPGARAWAKQIADTYALDIAGLGSLAANVASVVMPKIALAADAGLRFVLRDLGFSFDPIGVGSLNRGMDLSAYDVFINSGYYPLWGYLNGEGKKVVASFFAKGGDFIGVGRSGVDFAVNAKVVKVTYRVGNADDNGIVRVHYDSADFVAAQYPEDGYAFVYGPVWFTAYPASVHVSVSLDAGSFFVAGFWPGWDVAAGYPTVIRSNVGASDIVLFGLNPTFRAHPQLTFRMLADALYAG